MNVSSSSATSSTSTATATQTATATKPADNSSVSFEEEMQSAQQQEQNVVEQEENVPQKETDSKQNNSEPKESQIDILQGKAEVGVEAVDAKLDTSNLLSLNIQQLIDTRNQMLGKNELFQVGIITTEDLTNKIGQTLNYSVVEISESDAQFFVDVVKNNNASVQNVVQDIQHAIEFGMEEVQKSANVSKTLLNALQNSMKTGQAVRIDFGNDVAVVMRVGRDGTLMANFIPGDKAVEEYLKNNIDFLKQRFEEENVKYSQLSYSQHHQQERKQQNKNDKENKHE